MKMPEWLKKIIEELQKHKEEANIHRAIHVSDKAPTSADGKDGDIWIQYEA